MAIRRFAREMYRHLAEDDIQNVGAMLAYYSVLALFPMVVLVLALAMLVMPDSVIHQGVQLAAEMVPPAVRGPIEQRIDTFTQQAHGLYAILGAVLALWGARGGAMALMAALGAMHHTRETRSWLRRQLVATAVTASVAVLLVIALGLYVATVIAGRYLQDRFALGPAFDYAWTGATWVAVGVLVMLVWAILYKFLPNTHEPFRIFTPGTFVGIAIWLATSYGLSVYLAHFHSYETTYGTLGGAIIFLTWLWLSNIALLVGAEVDDVVRRLRAEPNEPPVHLPDHAPAHA